jgi:hypothetical protein
MSSDLTPFYRAGIVRISRAFGARRLQFALPPEHRLAAIRPIDEHMDACLVEGPSMPPAIDGEPLEVAITLTTFDQDACGIRLEAVWRHDDAKPWIVGTWPDVVSMRDHLDGLAGDA